MQEARAKPFALWTRGICTKNGRKLKHTNRKKRIPWKSKFLSDFRGIFFIRKPFVKKDCVESLKKVLMIREEAVILIKDTAFFSFQNEHCLI